MIRYLFFILIFHCQAKAQQLIPYLQDSLYGYATLDGQLVVKPKYEHAELFNEQNIAFATENGIWKILTSDGQELISYKGDNKPKINKVNQSSYPRIRSNDQTFENLFWIKHLDESYQIINTSSNKVSDFFVYEKNRLDFSHRYSPINFAYGYIVIKTLTGKFQVLNSDGDIVLETDSPPIFQNANVIAYQKSNETIMYFIDKKSEISIPFNSINQFIDNDLLIVSDNIQKDNSYFSLRFRYKFGLSDSDGNLIIDTIYENLSWYNYNNLIAKKDDKTFIIDFSGKRLTQKNYKSIYPLNEIYFVANTLDEKKVLLDSTGLEIGLGPYDQIRYQSHEKYYNWSKGKLCGVLDTNLVELISYPAKSVYQGFNKDYFLVDIDGKKGAVYKDGTIVVDPIYSECYMYEDSFFRIEMRDHKGLVSLDGEVLLEPIYDRIVFEKRNGEELIRAKLNDKYACYDTQMTQLSELVYSKSYLPHRQFDWFDKDGLEHLVDRYGKPLGVSAKSFQLNYVNADSTIVLVAENLDSTINVLIDGYNYLGGNNEIKLNVIRANVKSGVFAYEQDGVVGVMDYKNKILIEPAIREVHLITRDLIFTKKANKFFVYNHKGELVFEDGFDNVGSSAIGGLRRVQNKIEGETFEYVGNSCFYGKDTIITRNYQKFGYINNTGEMIVPMEYNHTFRYCDTYAFVGRGFEEGNRNSFLVDTLGQVVLETNYDKLYPLNSTDESRHYKATLNKKAGIINFEGEEIIPIEYKSISGFIDTTLFSVRDTNDIWHLINRENQKLYSDVSLHTEGYDQFIYLPNNKYLVYPNGNSEIIDAKGNSYLKINGQNILVKRLYDEAFLEVDFEGFKYYINTTTLFEYRE